MTLRTFLGVDVGTQGCKGVLLEENGHILASTAFEHQLATPRPGWAEHDADRVWWGGFRAVVKSLLAQSSIDPRRISAVGISALTTSLLPVDARGRPQRAAILYADTRAHAEMTAMNARLLPDSAPPLTSHDAGPKIIWFREHEPEKWRQTRAILNATGYVIAKLTNRHVIDAFTAFGWRPFYDLDRRAWDEAACDRFGVPVEWMPDIVDMTEVVGTVSVRAAAETGLAPGTAVIGGATDFFAEMISTGADAAGEVVVSYGTTFSLAAFSATPIEYCPQLIDALHASSGLRPLYPGLYAVAAAMQTSGALARWFRDTLAGETLRPAEQQRGNAYEQLARGAAATPPGSMGLVVLPYFSGERAPIHDDLARGGIFGLTLAHGRGHLYRALLEGVAYGLRHNLDLVRAVGVSPRRIVATGGGTRNRLWTQIVSDVTGLSQTVIAPSNAALGAAFLAGYALESFRRVSDVRRWARPEREVHPRDENHEIYQRYYRVYRRLYERTKEELHELARLSAEAPLPDVPVASDALAARIA